MLIKICGMRDGLNIQQVKRLKPDLMGFIFYAASKRYVGKDFDKNLLPQNTQGIKPVAVFVNESDAVVNQTIETYGFNTIQLHGTESPAYCASFKNAGITVLKAFGVHPEFRWESLQPYSEVCDYFLFDTSTADYGGSGKKFDWTMLNGYTLDKPFFLSGGIGVEDADKIRSIIHPRLAGIDINSRFEVIPAMKDVKLLEEFMIGLKHDL